MDASDLTQSSSLSLSDLRPRRVRRLSTPSRTVRFGDHHDATTTTTTTTTTTSPPILTCVHEFPNEEFCSNNSKLRKKVWYSSLEIRAIKQANIDLCRDQEQQQRRRQEEEAVDWRGLEHLLEGESKRRQRIRDFVNAILKLQTERRKKGSKPETTAEALCAFARSQSRTDRRRAQKVGKLDTAASSHSDKNSKPLERQKSSSFLFGRSSSRRKLMSMPRLRRGSSALVCTTTTPATIEPTVLRRNFSGDSFHKRRTLMRRMSNKASALSNSIRHLGSSSRSLVSTTSSTESSHSFTTTTTTPTTAALLLQSRRHPSKHQYGTNGIDNLGEAMGCQTIA